MEIPAIIEAIIKYIVIIEVDMENIKKKVLDDVWNILIERRKEAIEKEEKIRSDAMEKIGFSLFDANKTTLAQFYSK